MKKPTFKGRALAMDNMGLNTATTVNVFNDYTEYVLSDISQINSSCFL